MFIFAFCSTAGWVLEFLYRSMVEKKFVNPGFLSGCCLPIYGTGGISLYILCMPMDNLVDSIPLKILLVFFGGSLIMTLIELIGGFILLKFFDMRLWDYTELKFNFKGIICLEFSLIWGLCCLGFYFIAYPWLKDLANLVCGQTQWVLFIGIYFGVFIVDLSNSLDLATKIKAYAKESKRRINFERLKTDSMGNLNTRLKKLGHFFLPTNKMRSYIDGVYRATQEKADELHKIAEEKLKRRK